MKNDVTENLKTEPMEPENGFSPQPSPQFEPKLISLAKIKASPTQPRKFFDPQKQHELEDSMRALGFTISTLLVRPVEERFEIEEDAEKFWVLRFTPNPAKTPALIEDTVEGFPTRDRAEALLHSLQGCYELVAGERRLRAAKAVGITEAPCIVRQLSDQEVLEIQLVENIQRDDLTAIEESEGLCRLLALRDADGKPVHTCETLAKATGKSVRHIERRRNLARLQGEARAAVEAGTLPPNTALLIARIPDEKLREKATKEILHPKYHPAPLTLRQSEELVQREFMRDLRKASFDPKDATIVPVELNEQEERVAGGACTDCPFRLGNATALASDEALPSGMHQMCMNPRCYELKVEAGWKRWQEAETSVDGKRRALSEKECARIYRFGDQMEWNTGLVDLSDRPDSNDLKAGKEAPGTWRAMVKGKELEVLVVKDRNGRAHELVNRELAITAAIENGCKVLKELKGTAGQQESGGGSQGLGGSGQGRTHEQHRAVIWEEADATELDAAEDMALAEEFAKPRAKLPPGFWPEIMQTMLEDYCGDAPDRLEERRGWKNQSLMTEMQKLTENEQIGVVTELLFLCSVDCHEDGSRLIKLFGIDAKPIRKAAADQVKAAQKKRRELRAEIGKAATSAGLDEAKDLDVVAEKHAKKRFIDVTDVGALQAMLEEIRKRDAGKNAETQSPQSKKEPAKKGGLSPEARAKIMAAQKARWAKAKKGAVK